ncbi:unnamed protein product [Prunus brigantina]
MAARTGCVFRDYRGHSLGGESRSCILSSPEETEALAVLMGLNLAAELDYQNIVVECDAKIIVDFPYPRGDLEKGSRIPVCPMELGAKIGKSRCPCCSKGVKRKGG